MKNKIKLAVLLILAFIIISILIPQYAFANQNGDISGFVTRFYQLCLSREPDLQGLQGWTNYIQTGQKSAAEVAHGFVFSTEFVNRKVSNNDFVTIMYRAFFNREPDPNGFNGWVEELNRGRTRQQVFNGFINSAEFKNLCTSFGIGAVTPATVTPITPTASNAQVAAFVIRFYETCLSRGPDAEGLASWVNALTSRRHSGADIANGFVNSQEFKNRNLGNTEFVNIMYQAFFGRPADATGFSGWVAELNAGRSRQYVLAGFVNSTEFKNLCASYGIDPGRLDPGSGALTQPAPVASGNVNENTSFIGYSDVSVDRMVAMFSRYNPAKADKARRLANFYVHYGRHFNLRADLAWAQMCHETNFLKYTGTAREEWNNFCGLGVTGPADVGARFATEELGVIAHFAHLAWYYYPGPINEYTNQQYDPRYFTWSPYNGDTSLRRLNGSWAVPGHYYATAIAKYANEI